VVLRIGLKNPLTAQPPAFSVNTPPRIAFDFPDTANGLGKSSQDLGNGDLRSANIVQVGNRTRLVINLNQPLAYDTQIDGSTLLIFLQGKATAAPTTHFAEAQSLTDKHSLANVGFRRGKNGEGRIEIDLSDTGVGIDIRRQSNSLVVDFMQTTLPRNLQRKLDVTDFSTPVVDVDTFAQGQNVRMVIEPNGQWEHTAYQMDKKFIIEVRPVVEDPEKQKRGMKDSYDGERLTLNFQNIAVREALYVIADFINSNNSGVPMNMLVSDSVSGNLTLRLKDVPWDQALDIILQSKGLDMRKNGNVIQIAPREEIAAKEKLNLSADQEIAELEALRTESFQLSYQKGDVVAAMLANTAQRILSKRGSAVVDARTNTLFVKDTPSALEEVRKLIRQIDVPVRQVMIEARFVQAQEQFSHELGGRLNFTGPTASVPSGFSSSTVTGNVNIPNTTTAGGLTLSLFNAASTKTLSLELLAANTDGTTKNIASPRVVTADSTEAVIKQGTEIPYTQDQGLGVAATTEFKDAVLQLKVTPKITPDDNINMKLDVTQDTVGQIFNGVPSIDNKQIQTQVLVENGGTVVIGGIYTLAAADTVTKVPLFGDIPLLGWLFKDKLTTETKTELLIFITPKILKDSMNQF
jgi:type IV pilus assembly protein PilQ